MALITFDPAAGRWKEGSSVGAGRVQLYDAAGNPIGVTANPLVTTSTPSLLLPGSLGAWAVASFRIPGIAAAAQVLATIRNNAGARDIVVRRLAIDVSYTAAAVDLVAAYFRLWNNTGVTPSGGAAPTKHPLKASYGASQAATEILFAASVDGTNSTITHATPASTPWREQAKSNIMTAAGLAGNISDYELIKYEQHPMYIESGQVAALILVGSANDVTTRHYTVKIVLEEVTP